MYSKLIDLGGTLYPELFTPDVASAGKCGGGHELNMMLTTITTGG